tara:strand:+ start:249 stop:479 length:231 start_codon:yes stop_codon:yes gene_type:complete
MFKHPKYYQELAKVRKQLEKEQADKLTSYKLPGPKPISEGNKGLIHKRKGGRVGPKATSTQATSDQASSGSRTNKR